MNTIGSNPNQDVANRAANSITTNSIKNTLKPATTLSTSSKVDIPDEVLSLFVNMIAELLGVLKPDQRNDESGFSLDFPLLPTYSDRDNAGESMFTDLAPLPTMNHEGDNSTNSTSFNLSPLPSFVSSSTDGGATTSVDGASTDRALNVAPLPSLVSSTGSLSTTELPKAFNPPAIPSLTGGSAELPSINASDSAPDSGTAMTNSVDNISTGRALNVAPLPSLVSSTGSLSTTELPKAFNPPAIPSLTGGSAELPSVNASDSAPVQASSNSNQATSAFPIPNLLGSSGETRTTSTRSLSNPSIFIPSLLGNSTLSSLSSTQGFSLTGANGIVDNLSTSDSENSNRTRTNHFK